MTLEPPRLADLTREQLRALIERLRDSVIDCDIVVDDRRRELAAAEAERRRTVEQLIVLLVRATDGSTKERWWL
jgi:hypothetical protein